MKVMKIYLITGKKIIRSLDGLTYDFSCDWLNFYRNGEFIGGYHKQYIEHIDIHEEREEFRELTSRKYPIRRTTI